MISNTSEKLLIYWKMLLVCFIMSRMEVHKETLTNIQKNVYIQG